MVSGSTAISYCFAIQVDDHKLNTFKERIIFLMDSLNYAIYTATATMVKYIQFGNMLTTLCVFLPAVVTLQPERPTLRRT